MNAANQRRLTPFLIVLAVLLAVLLLLLFIGVGQHVHWRAPRQLAPLPPAGNAANLPRPVPLQQFADVWQAPLFNPNRKPVAQAAADGSNLGDLELTGVILTQGMHIALLHDKHADKDLRLKQGEALPDGSITLVEVHPRSALFDSAAGRTELKLPAGAPIDPPRKGNDDNGNRRDDGQSSPRGESPAGTGVRRVQPAGNRLQPGGSGRFRQSPSSDSHDVPAVLLNRLRKLKQHQQQRRAERAAAATHSKE